LAWVIFGFSRSEIDSLSRNEGTSFNRKPSTKSRKSKGLGESNFIAQRHQAFLGSRDLIDSAKKAFEKGGGSG
jgi:hypothetical protein